MEKTAAELALDKAVEAIERHGYFPGGGSCGRGRDGGFYDSDEMPPERLSQRDGEPPRFSEFGAGDL